MICYIAQKEKQAMATATVVVGQHSQCNSALLPSNVIDFAMLPSQKLVVQNSFIVRCHVTSK